MRGALLATKLFIKPPLAILNGTSNPIGVHNEHSLFQRISIHLHYDVKASKHLASLLTTDNASGKLLTIFILSFRVANFFFANSQNTQPHYITDMTYKCIILFVNQHFPGLPASGTHCIFLLLHFTSILPPCLISELFCSNGYSVELIGRVTSQLCT
jgi:hypothetical protein